MTIYNGSVIGTNFIPPCCLMLKTIAFLFLLHKGLETIDIGAFFFLQT